MLKNTRNEWINSSAMANYFEAILHKDSIKKLPSCLYTDARPDPASHNR